MELMTIHLKEQAKHLKRDPYPYERLLDGRLSPEDAAEVVTAFRECDPDTTTVPLVSSLDDYLASLGNHQRKRLIAEAHNRVRSKTTFRIPGKPWARVYSTRAPRRFWGNYHSDLRQELRSIHGEMLDRSQESAQW